MLLSHAYVIIIDHDIVAPGHERDLFDDLNSIDKHLIFVFMTNMNFPGYKGYGDYMTLYTTAQKEDISLAKWF